VKSGTKVVRNFVGYTGSTWYAQDEDISISWDGTDNDGKEVNSGTYSVEVVAQNDDGKTEKSVSVEVQGTSSVSDGVIEDLTLDPSSVWDPTDEELQIEFELTEEVKSLTIDIKKGNKVVEILDDKLVDDGDITESFDGTDDDGDFLKEGVYEVIVRADGDKVSKFIEIKYEEPTIVDAFVTKTEFDPTEDEFTNLVFRLDAAAEVTIDVYRGNKKEFTLLEDEEVKKNRYYTVQWDGFDEDGDEVTEGNDWKFKIEAKNATEDDVMDAVTVEVDVNEDEVSDKKSNITNDYTSPVVFDEDTDAVISINYCIDEEAEVSISIHKGSSTSGASEIDLLDEVGQTTGCHNVSWEAVDEDGKDLKDGVYSYKIITKANGSNKETEVGKFVVGTGEEGQTPEPPKPPEPPVSDCGGYWDTSFVVNAHPEMCDAIEWATAEGIFHGYNDGSFGVYMPINRAEVLKTILEAYDVTIFPADGTNQGLTDVDVNAWYMPYVRTGKFFGMVKGYPNGTFMPGSYVNRAEVLKLALEASHSFTSYTVPVAYQSHYSDVAMDAWFLSYSEVAYSYILMDEGYDMASGKQTLNPGAVVTRGEVALLLYRMYKAGLLGDYFGWEIPFEEMEVTY
ncbi:S-layer homology domain-containing protein, partial [Candidatus Peregrinibacteria bacterium]|nr:S-layer homology domain-containing protein [Candidatus Peregrinibacteria bacterium]